jgi:hypothetical protein
MSNNSLIEADCISAHDHIKEFIMNNAINDNFRHEHRELYQFFLQSYFNMYLYRFRLRLYKVEDMATLFTDFRQKFYVESNFLPKLREKNEKCLEFARKVKRFTEEQFHIFTEISKKYHAGRYDITTTTTTTNSLKSFAKSVIGFGTKAKYEKMVHRIPPCFYPLMDTFADSILTYENNLKELLEKYMNSTNIEINSNFIAEWENKLSVDRLLEILQTSLAKLFNPQGAEEVQLSDLRGAEQMSPLSDRQSSEKRHLLSDRQSSEQMPPLSNRQSSEKRHLLSDSQIVGGSRRHRRHTHRRHSKHSHKSVKRSKKGKKVMKSHTRKRHAHVRNQNKRRNRSIK